MLGQRLSINQYSAKIAKIQLPDSVKATKGAGKNATWKYGDARDPADTQWWLSDQNPNLLERNKYIVRFDTAIAPNLFLDDEALFNDALTKRIYVVHGIEFGIRGGAMGAQNMSKCCEKIDWLFRWKWSENIARFEHATASQYNSLWVSLRSGPLGLVPIEQRVQNYLRGLDVLERDNCFRLSEGKMRVRWTELSHQLGVPWPSLRAKEFRLNLFEQTASIFPKLGKDLMDTMKIEESNKPESESSFESYLGVAADLYRLSIEGHLKHDSMLIDPLGGNSVKKIARDLGRERGRTPTLPPQFLLQLMDRAVVWVFEYSDWILDAIAEGKKLDELPVQKRPAARRALAASLNAKRPVGAPEIWPAWHGHFKSKDPFLFPDLIQFLLLSCAILISSFGARRLNETLNIRKGCLHEVRRGVFELSIYIEKTLQDMDRIPVPAMVAGVVDVLEMLTESSRDFTGSEWLFEVVRKNGLEQRYQRSSNIRKSFNTFIEYHNLEAPEGLDDWNFASHQLRRGFAITFFYGFECRDLDALSWFLRHFDPEMTRIYIRTVLPGQMARLQREIEQRKSQMRGTITDEEKMWFLEREKQLRELQDRGSIWEVERQDAVVYRLLSLYNRSDAAIGKGAPHLHENINELVERASAQVRIGRRTNNPDVFKKALVAEFKKFAETHILDPVPGKHAFCSYGPDHGDLEDAACRELEQLYASTKIGEDTRTTQYGPNRLFSGFHPCLSCVYGVKLQRDVAAGEEKMKRLKGAVAQAGSAELRRSAQSTLDELIAMTDAANRAAASKPLW